MNCFSIIYCTVLFSVTSIFAQEKIDKYVVAKGETVNQIAQKFKITPYDIYKLNPDAQNGLKPNTVLLIPKSNGKSNVTSSKVTKAQPKPHTMDLKETLFRKEKK